MSSSSATSGSSVTTEASVTAVENGGGVVEAVSAAEDAGNAVMDDAAVFGVDTDCVVEDCKSNLMNVVSGVRVDGKMVREAVWRIGRRIGGPETKIVIRTWCREANRLLKKSLVAMSLIDLDRKNFIQ